MSQDTIAIPACEIRHFGQEVRGSHVSVEDVVRICNQLEERIEFIRRIGQVGIVDIPMERPAEQVGIWADFFGQYRAMGARDVIDCSYVVRVERLVYFDFQPFTWADGAD